MTTPHLPFPEAEECKRVEYLINHDERLKEVAVDFIQANAELAHYIDQGYGKELGYQIVAWCYLQTCLYLRSGEKESSDGN